MNLPDSNEVSRIGFIDDFHCENIKKEPSEDSFRIITKVAVKHENSESDEDSKDIHRAEEVFIEEINLEPSMLSKSLRETHR